MLQPPVQHGAEPLEAQSAGFSGYVGHSITSLTQPGPRRAFHAARRALDSAVQSCQGRLARPIMNPDVSVDTANPSGELPGPGRSHPALSRLAHRPWPLPAGPWAWRQTWCDLLFAHWRIDAAVLRPLVPEELEVQQFDGTAWIALVPFRMTGVMRRPLPDLPWISAFPELNVRTYVDHGGKAGVWFLSLDATNPLAVWAARRYFHLPYVRAQMDVALEETEVSYDSVRRDGTARFRGRYRPSSPVYASRPGTLEHWLTERYCLYAKTPAGVLQRTDVHHAPWPLQGAEVRISDNTVFEAHGLDVAGPPAHVHFSRRLDVVVWPSESVEA